MNGILDEHTGVGRTLNEVLAQNTVFMKSVVVVLFRTLLPEDSDSHRTASEALWLGDLAAPTGFVTEYYASCSCVTMREITETQKTVGCHRYDLRL